VSVEPVAVEALSLQLAPVLGAVVVNVVNSEEDQLRFAAARAVAAVRLNRRLLVLQTVGLRIGATFLRILANIVPVAYPVLLALGKRLALRTVERFRTFAVGADECFAATLARH
jgi:hypothetical protein